MFWWRPRVNCDLGKRTVSPASITQPAPLPLPVELLGLPSPAGLGVRGGSHTELGFSTVSPGEASVPEPDGQVLGCVATLGGGKSKLPVSLATTTLGRRSAHHLLQTCRHHPQQETVWISPAKSQILAIAQWGEGKVAQSGSIQSMRPSEATVWDQDQVLSPLLWARRASFPMGNSFDLSP